MNVQINLVMWRDLHSGQIIPIQQHIPIGGWEFIVRNTNEFTLIDIPFFLNVYHTYIEYYIEILA